MNVSLAFVQIARHLDQVKNFKALDEKLGNLDKKELNMI